MAFTNTREILGDDATLVALLTDSDQLTEFNDDVITSIGSYGLSYKQHLRSITLPSVDSVGIGAFSNCENLEYCDLSSSNKTLSTIDGYAFRYCKKLKTLILRNNNKVNPSSNAFLDTYMITTIPRIYVPRSLLNDYRTDNVWGTYKHNIWPIEDYPVNDLSTINMTWTQIKAAVDDESFFSSGIELKTLKKIVYGQHTVYAQLVKIDSTEKYIDFVIKDFDEKTCMFDFNVPGHTTNQGYPNSIFKLRLDEIYNNELPSDLKAAITPVTKQYFSPVSHEIEQVTAPLWALNTIDVGLVGASVLENEGGRYFPNASEPRIKAFLQDEEANEWLLGSASNRTAATYYKIGISGALSSVLGSSKIGLVFGFRIAKSSS